MAVLTVRACIHGKDEQEYCWDCNAAGGRMAAWRRLQQDYDHMMGTATVLYNRMSGTIGKQDMERNRCQIGEAIVGEAWARR